MPSRPDPSLAAALASAVETYLTDPATPGVAVAVTDRRGLVAEARGGFAERESRTPVGPTTLFEIGSIGKTFTARVILELEAEGRLSVDDPVVRHLPWFRVPRTGDRITIHHLLSHTAGITSGIDGTPEATVQVWTLRDLRPGSAPGRRFHYSNVGYKALGLIIEAIERAPYAEVIRRRVMAPLGMRDSSPDITNAIRDRLAVGYVADRDDVPWQDPQAVRPATWLQTGTADGSVAATAPDLARLAGWLLTDRSGMVARMSTPVPALQDGAYGYGLFWIEAGGRRYVGHGGGMVGFISGMLVDPKAGLGAVVLQNGYGGGPLSLAVQAIRQARAVREGRDPTTEGFEPISEGDDAEDDAGSEAGSEAPPLVTTPTDEQAVVTGEWRSHDPWEPVFWVEARGDALWLRFTGEPDGFEAEQPLIPMAGGWYRIGTDRLGPERLRFDLVIDGFARRAWLSGWPHYRADTPFRRDG